MRTHKQMADEPAGNQTRRQFLAAAARAAALVLIAGGAARALFGPRRPGGDQRCVGRSICRGCGRFDDCILPAAASAKQSTGARS